MDCSTIGGYYDSTSPTFASAGIGIRADIDAAVSVSNSIVAEFYSQDGMSLRTPISVDSSASVSIIYSDIEMASGTWSGVGNINADPIFSSPGTYDILPGSGCQDSGDDFAIPHDEGDIDDDFSITELIPADLGVLTTGILTGRIFGSAVDIGAWEIPAQCSEADWNNDGHVSVQDLFDFLADYFAQDPAADINNSGTVSVQDIFDYLALYFAPTCP